MPRTVVNGLISLLLPMPLWVLFSFHAPSAVLRIRPTLGENTTFLLTLLTLGGRHKPDQLLVIWVLLKNGKCQSCWGHRNHWVGLWQISNTTRALSQSEPNKQRPLTHTNVPFGFLSPYCLFMESRADVLKVRPRMLSFLWVQKEKGTIKSKRSLKETSFLCV